MSDFDISTGFDELLSGLAEISKSSDEVIAVEELTKLEEGEMRSCAVLFADIKGFTALSEKLRAEEVKLIIDHTFKILTQEIRRFNGEIDKYIGDCIMAVFGSEISGDNDSEMAIRAGLSMLDRLGQINTLLNQKGIELGLRIGINYGEVVYGTIGVGREKDITVMGDTVNTAQRMESNAPVNSILITYGTKKYLGDLFIYEDLDPIFVKNKVEPVPVAVVKSVNHVRTERWQRSKLAGRTQFVGRNDELDALVKLYRQSLCSETRGVAIAAIDGTPGIGKSRLIYEMRNVLKTETVSKITIIKTVNPNYTTRPYYALIDILRQYFGISEADSQDETKLKLQSEFDSLKRAGHNVSDNLPIIGSMMGLSYDDARLKLDAASLEAERRVAIKRLFEALTAKIAKDTGLPFVICIDDLQWADEGSINGIGIIANEVETDGDIILILAHRSDYELPECLASFDNLINISLGPLSENECKQIIESMLEGYVVPHKFARLIADRSQGNPFFLEEIVHLLVERNVFRLTECGWQIFGRLDSISIPHSVNSIVLSRIDRLDKALKELLQKASVIGSEFTLDILCRVLCRVARDLEREATRNLLNELADKQMVFLSNTSDDGDESYIFKNLLVQEAAYGTLLLTNKRTLHKLTAESILAKYEDRTDDYAAILGFHYDRGEDYKLATDYYERAAMHFGSMYRFTDARRMNESALRTLKSILPLTNELRVREISLGLLLLETMNSLGRYKEGLDIAEALLPLVVEIGTKSDLARIHRVLGVFIANLGDIDKGLEHQDKARALCEELGDERTLGRILLTLGLISERRGKRSEAMECFGNALDAATKGGDKSLEGSVFLNRGRILTTLGRLDDAYVSYKTALEVFDKLGDRLGKTRAYSNIGIIASMQGRFDDARGYYQNGLELNRAIGNKAEEANMLLNLGLVCFEQNEYACAIEYGTQAENIFNELGNTEMEGVALGNIGLALEHFGNNAAALDYARRSLACAEMSGNVPEIGLRRTYIKKFEVRRDNVETTLNEINEALVLLNETGIPEYIVEGKLNLAQTLFELGEIDDAVLVFNELKSSDATPAWILRIADSDLKVVGNANSSEETTAQQ